MSRNLVFVETARQVEWAAARRPSLLSGSLVVAATPDAAHACQKAGIGYSKMEDLTALRLRRSEYNEGLGEYMAWEAWLDEWVTGLEGRAEYVARLGPDAIDALRPEPRPSGSVDYGSYR